MPEVSVQIGRTSYKRKGSGGEMDLLSLSFLTVTVALVIFISMLLWKQKSLKAYAVSAVTLVIVHTGSTFGLYKIVTEYDLLLVLALVFAVLAAVTYFRQKPKKVSKPGPSPGAAS